MVTVIETSTGFCCKMCGRYYVDYYKKITFSFEIVSLFCQLNEGANCINNQNIAYGYLSVLFYFPFYGPCPTTYFTFQNKATRRALTEYNLYILYCK